MSKTSHLELDLLQWLQLRRKIQNTQEELATLRLELHKVEKGNHLIAEVKGLLRRRAKGNRVEPQRKKEKKGSRNFDSSEGGEVLQEVPSSEEVDQFSQEEEEKGKLEEVPVKAPMNEEKEKEVVKERKEEEKEKKVLPRGGKSRENSPESSPKKEKKKKPTLKEGEKGKRKRSSEADSRMKRLKRNSSQQSPFESTRLEMPKNK